MHNRLIEHQFQAFKRAFIAWLPYALFMMLGTVILAFAKSLSWWPGGGWGGF